MGTRFVLQIKGYNLFGSDFLFKALKKIWNSLKSKEFTEIASKAQNILRFSEYHFDKIEIFCVFLSYNSVGVSGSVLIGTKRFR